MRHATLEQKIESMLNQVLKCSVDSGGDLKAALLELDSILREHSDQLPRRLVHFLENRSYQKAWDYINEQKA